MEGAAEPQMGHGLGCCVSQRKVCLYLVSAELSPAPPGSGNKPEEL